MSVEILADRTAEEVIARFAAAVSRVSGSPQDEIAEQIDNGLLPFLDLAQDHPGAAFPPPVVFELMDHIRCYGPESLRSRVDNLRISEPENDTEALAAYAQTLRWLSQKGVKLNADIWPATGDFTSAAGNYK